MNNIDLNKLIELAIKAAAGSFPVPVAGEEDRYYCDEEISYLAFAAAVNPAAFLAIVNDLQTEVAAKQQNVDYLADRLPETQHNGMIQLSHQLADVQELLRGTQEKLGKALVRNSEYAGELARRDAAAGEPIGYIDPDSLKEYRGVKSGGSWSATPKTGEYNQTLPIYLAAPSTVSSVPNRWKDRAEAAEAELVARRGSAAGDLVEIARALEGCDWQGVSIGGKAVISAAVAALRDAQPAALPPEKIFVDDYQKYQWADRALMLARVDGYNQAIADAKALGCQPVASAPAWISVSDQLPDDESTVLVCQQDGITFCAEFQGGEFYPDEFPNLPNQGKEITHWMDMPEAPAPRGSDA